jgi:flagellar basal body-associated protein FliL
MEPNQEPIQSSEPAVQKQRISWKMILIVFAIALIAAGLAGGITWYLMNQSQNNLKADNDKSITSLQKQISDLKKVQPITVTPATTTTTTDWHTYKNTDYNFQLTFTDKWSGYSVEKTTPSGTELANFAFELPSNDGNFISQTKTSYAAFNIMVYNTADYQAIDRSHPVPNLPTAISSNDGKTFAYVMSTQWPSDWKLNGGTNGDVQTVISTFKFY